MKKNASDAVVEIIQKKLQSGEWTVGMKIATETQLMRESGVGRPAVREAIEKLVAMDILAKRQGDGTYVNDFSVRSYFKQLMPGLMLNHYDSIAILEFREVLEPACVRMFIEHFDPEIFASLESYTAVMMEHRHHQCNTAIERSHEADRDYHLAIARGSDNPIIVKVMEIMYEALTNYHFDAQKTIGLRTGADEHAAILKAIEARDSEMAALLMKRHIQRSKHDIKKYLERQT